MGKIAHQHAHNMIQASVDHPLTSKRQAQLDAHLTECGDCRQYAEHLRKLENDLHRVMQERWHKQHANVSIATIQSLSRRLRMRKTIWNSVKVLAAIALLATLLIVVNSFLHQPGSSTAAGSQTLQESTTSENASPSPISEFQTSHIEYVVQQGDTLLKIANLFNVSISSIVDANNLKSGSFVLYAGQTLIIPITGELVAITDFGKLVVFMDPTGTRVTKISYQFSEWTCGSITYSNEIVDASGWLITDNKLSVISTFDREGVSQMFLSGTYDTTNQMFSGTWDEVSNSTTCSGKWEASAPK